jgi:hypothetical protein
MDPVDGDTTFADPVRCECHEGVPGQRRHSLAAPTGEVRHEHVVAEV